MPKYLFRLTRQMTVDGEVRQPGDAVPEAASWPNLRHYESLGWVERVPVPNDFDGGVAYPPVAITSKLAEVLVQLKELRARLDAQEAPERGFEALEPR